MVKKIRAHEAPIEDGELYEAMTEVTELITPILETIMEEHGDELPSQTLEGFIIVADLGKGSLMLPFNIEPTRAAFVLQEATVTATALATDGMTEQ